METAILWPARSLLTFSPYICAPLLEGLRDNIERTDAAVTPVIIAQHISDEARAVCKENQAGFLDLEGNARIALGEVFILKRTIPHVARRSVINESVRPVAHHTAA